MFRIQNFRGTCSVGDGLMNANRRTDNEGNSLFFRRYPRAYNTHVTGEVNLKGGFWCFDGV